MVLIEIEVGGFGGGEKKEKPDTFAAGPHQLHDVPQQSGPSAEANTERNPEGRKIVIRKAYLIDNIDLSLLGTSKNSTGAVPANQILVF